MAALVAFIIAAVLFVVNAAHGHLIVSNPADWGFVFLAVGFVLDHIPASWVRRG